MEEKKSTVKMYSFTYGVGVYTTTLVLAAFIFLLGIFLLPKAEGIGLVLCSLLFVLLSFYLRLAKYMNYITLTNTTVSTKKKTLAWDEVYITMSYYFIHPGVRRDDDYLFFDDHYLSKEEIYSRRVKKEAFYLMVTPKRLEVILEKYNKKIQLLDCCGTDRKGLYYRVLEYNKAIDKSQDID